MTTRAMAISPSPMNVWLLTTRPSPVTSSARTRAALRIPGCYHPKGARMRGTVHKGPWRVGIRSATLARLCEARGMSALRTPDDRFVDLPDFPYPPSYLTVGDGL